MNIINKSHTIRLLIACFLVMFALPAASNDLPLSTQEEDSVFTFRFFPGKNEFYAPGLNNGAELARLYDCVKRHKEQIKAHDIMLYVEGHSLSNKSDAKNLAIARIRSNRVKSELITLKGLKEDNFITRNHPGVGNFVTVRLFNVERNDAIPPKIELPPVVTEQKTEDENIPPVVEQESSEPIVEPVPEPEPSPEPEPEPEPFVEAEPQNVEFETPEAESKERPDSRFAIKTNMFDYAVLMPNGEIEWKFADRWSVAFEIQGAWYAKESDPRKVYRLATWIPEVRYWVIDRSRWHGMYVGLFGGPGIYDLAKSTVGHEGEGGMVGVSAGYMWPIGKHLSLDAELGVGYLRIRDKEYRPLDGHFLYQLTRNINYFGPLRLKLSLVWRIPQY